MDNESGGVNGFPVEWQVPWGHLEPYLIDPKDDINVTQYEFFNFSSGVRCVCAECGGVTAILDPQSQSIGRFNATCTGTSGCTATNLHTNLMASSGIIVKILNYQGDFESTSEYFDVVIDGVNYDRICDDEFCNDCDFHNGTQNYTIPKSYLADGQLEISFDSSSDVNICDPYVRVEYELFHTGKDIIPMFNGTPFHTITQNPRDYSPGDVVAWKLDNGLLHIGLVINEKSKDMKRVLVVHNIGSGTQKEDVLFNWEIIGHYRYKKQYKIRFN